MARQGSLGEGDESGHQPGPESWGDVGELVASDYLSWRERREGEEEEGGGLRYMYM